MPTQTTDFFQVGERQFESLEELTDHVSTVVDLGDLEGGDLSVIGTITGYETFEELLGSVEPEFQVLNRNGQLAHLYAREQSLPYYVYWHPDFPVWFTTGRKTEEIPETIGRFLRSRNRIGRLWINKREMEDLRQSLVASHERILMTYFTATRSRHSNVPADRRPDVDRTFQYYGRDALATFEEIKYEYGVLPTNLKFEKSDQFKFRVTNRGVFTIKQGGLNEVLEVIQSSIERLAEVKEAIDSSKYQVVENKFVEGGELPQSRPWAINLDSHITVQDVDKFNDQTLEEWEFHLSELSESFDSEVPHFKAKLRDKETLEEVFVRSNRSTIRVYPREGTGIGQSIRLFEFIADQIDPSAYASEVAPNEQIA